MKCRLLGCICFAAGSMYRIAPRSLITSLFQHGLHGSCCVCRRRAAVVGLLVLLRCHSSPGFSIFNMQEPSKVVIVRGVEFNPSQDRVFFDFDGVLHTSTQAVRRENGVIENQAVHYAEYWKLEPNHRMIDFIEDLSLNHGVACYMLTANDYRIAQLFIRHHAPQLCFPASRTKPNF